jgi:hypothetical protein
MCCIPLGGISGCTIQGPARGKALRKPVPRPHSRALSKGSEVDSKEPSVELAQRSLYSDEELANIESFADALNLMTEAGVVPEDISAYGTGFRVVEKAELVGVPFVILDWRFNEGAYGDEGFVSCEIVNERNQKLIINDGSTGLRDQLKAVTASRNKRGHSHPQGGLMCKDGLSRTNYFYNEQTKETSSKAKEGKGWVPASTFYIK